MFGLNEITWKEFMQFVCITLLFWYLIIFLLAAVKSSKKQKKFHYEDIQEEGQGHENLQPITVSSGDFPSKIIPVFAGEDIPLEVISYEETGQDEGYPVDTFTGDNTEDLSELLPEIHYQQ
jgi:hypothetical protein